MGVLQSVLVVAKVRPSRTRVCSNAWARTGLFSESGSFSHRRANRSRSVPGDSEDDEDEDECEYDDEYDDADEDTGSGSSASLSQRRRIRPVSRPMGVANSSAGICP